MDSISFQTSDSKQIRFQTKQQRKRNEEFKRNEKMFAPLLCKATENFNGILNVTAGRTTETISEKNEISEQEATTAG